MPDETIIDPISRRRFMAGAGMLAVGFLLPPTRALAAKDGLLRINPASPGSAEEAWLLLTPGAVAIRSGKVELGTGVQTALTQIVLEELYLPWDTPVDYVQGDTQLVPDQGTTAGSKTLQQGAPQLRQAAATAFAALAAMAADELGVPASSLTAADGRFRVNGSGRNVRYDKLLARADSVIVLDPTAPVKAPAAYTVVGQSVPRVDLPGKVTAEFEFVCDVTLPGMLHGRVIRPSGRNATFGSISGLDRAQAIPGFVSVVQNGNFVGVVAETEWAAQRAATAATGVAVTWNAGPPLLPQAQLADALRDPANQYRSTLEYDAGNVDGAIAAAGSVVEAQYFTPFQMHGTVGASSAVADVRSAPDPKTGMQVRVWSGTQGAGALRGAIADLLGVDRAVVQVIYSESSGCYGHDGIDDAAADAALLSKAVGRPVRVQWTRQNEHGWEPLGPAQAHDMRGVVDSTGVVAWSHQIYCASHNARPTSNAGTLIAGSLLGKLPAALPTTAGNTAGRNAKVTYTFPNQRVTAKLVRSFRTATPTSTSPSSPLTWTLPRSSALRSLGGFSNTWANESFLDELAVSAGLDPLKLRIDSNTDPRAVAVLEALKPAWASRPAGGNGVGAGVAYQQYETVEAYVATYVEVEVDASTGKVRVRRAVVAHDCGLIANPDGLRNQIEGNVIQGVSRALKEEVYYTQDRITTTVWDPAPPFSAPPQYSVIRFNEVPQIECILINRPDQVAWGAGEPAIGTMGAAIGNAVFAATGVRFRTLPLTPERVKARLGG